MTIRFVERAIAVETFIGEELLASPLFYSLLPPTSAIITDTTCEALYGKKLLENLKSHGLTASLYAIAPGEHSKTRETKASIEDWLLANKYGRDLCILALGGGVVCDLAGYVASTYHRGVPFVMLPTTLLAMCDASVGGKTGVNVPSGKNMIGTIYQPQAIFMDISTLKSLPIDEYKNGLVECIKHGIILDEEYFAYFEQHVEKIMAQDPSTLSHVIAKSVRIKKEIVQDDEHEVGKRRLLNFGHTIGHAIEVLTSNAIPHGRAVAIGIVAESYISMQLKILPEHSFERIINIFKAYGIDTTIAMRIHPGDFIEAMKIDKKALCNTPRFVLVQGIGSCMDCNLQYCQTVPADILEKTLNWLINNE